jgi:hypothetical protein
MLAGVESSANCFVDRFRAGRAPDQLAASVDAQSATVRHLFNVSFSQFSNMAAAAFPGRPEYSMFCSGVGS